MKIKSLAALALSAWLALAPAFAANQAPIQTPTTGPLSATQFTTTYLNPALLAIWSCNWGTTAPANGPGAAPGLHECWADTTTNPTVFKYYDGASWVTFGKLDTVAHTWTPTRQGVDLGTASIANTGTSGHNLGFLDTANTISAAWNLGTPSAVVLTNGTGLPIGTGVSGLGTGCATWLATPSSANLRACLTDEVGTGAAYFVGGALGTPASGTATNLTGLPLSTGITGFGTGVGAALAVNIGSAGAPVLFNGALGTPSSATLTNATGLPVSGLTGLGTGIATWLATPSSANLAAAISDETGSGLAVFNNSPALAGIPTAPTASFGTNTTQLATTQFVQAAVVGAVTGVTSINTNTGAFTLSHGIINSTNDIQFDVALQRGEIGGLTLSTAGSSSTFSIAAGYAVDSTASDFMKLAAFTKTTAAWTVGSGNGSLDTGTIANNTWYHAYLIKRPDTGVVDVATSTSASAPTTGGNIPVAYTLFRRIGSMKTIAGGTFWTLFKQSGNEFLWDATVADVAAATPTSASRSLYALASVPPGIVTTALVRAFYSGAATASILVTSPDESDQAPSGTVAGVSIRTTAASDAGYGELRKRTNASQQIGARSSTASGAFTVSTYGWIDPLN